jgi:predicted nucleic acid-binding protein
VSRLMRPDPLERVVRWVDGKRATELFLTAVTLAELLYGIGGLPDGRRRWTLADQLDERRARLRAPAAQPDA